MDVNHLGGHPFFIDVKYFEYIRLKNIVKSIDKRYYYYYIIIMQTVCLKNDIMMTKKVIIAA